MPRVGVGVGVSREHPHFCKTPRGSRRSLGDSGENLTVPVTHSCNFHIGSVCSPRPGNTEVALATHPPTRHRVLQNHAAPALPTLPQAHVAACSDHHPGLLASRRPPHRSPMARASTDRDRFPSPYRPDPCVVPLCLQHKVPFPNQGLKARGDPQTLP